MENPKKTNSHSLLWIGLGHLFIGLGIAGFILPLLPGTPFILLASACYMRGSPKLHKKLQEHPKYGQMLKDWEAGKGIPLKIKIFAITMMWLALSSTAFLVLESWPLRSILGITGLSVSLYLIKVPTKKP